jgi:CubicO group peptidase (beta-lactamase class C family)
MNRGNKVFRFVSLLVVLLFSQSVIPFSSVAEPEIFPVHVETEIQRMVNEGDIPSLHACIFSGSEKVWVRGFGEQTSNDTVFFIGSIQKVFVAISILQLYEDGFIGLNDDVNEYLPFTLKHPDFPNAPITIRRLLSHRSGLRATLPSEFCFDWEGLHYPEFRGTYYPTVIGIPLDEYLTECLPSDGIFYTSSNWLIMIWLMLLCLLRL